MNDIYERFIAESYKEHILLGIAETIPQTPDEVDLVLAHHHFTKELGFTDEYTIPRIIHDRHYKTELKRVRYFDASENVIHLKEIAKAQNVNATQVVRDAVHAYLKSMGYVPLQIEKRKPYNITRKQIEQFNVPEALLETCTQISVRTKTSVS